MELFIITSSIITLLTLISIIREPRKFSNCIYVLITLGFWGLTLIDFCYEYPGNGVLIAIIVTSIPLAYFGVMIYLFVSGIKVLKREGKSIANSLSLVLSLIMLLLPIFLVVLMVANRNREQFKIFAIIMTCTMYFMITFGGFFVYSVLYCLVPKRIKADYIIIHGAGISDDGGLTPLLKKRVDKAIRIYHKCKDKAIIIPSGGQGDDEVISEAEAMKRYLIENGINEKFIIKEEKSTTTYENLKFVKEIIDEREEDKAYKCIFVTNNYHVLRTSFYAKKLKLNAKGVGCRTAGYYLPSAFIREYAGVMKMNLISLLILGGFVVLEMMVL